LTHDELLAEVLQLAAARGVPYIVANGLKSTPGAADLVLAGRTGLVCAELKSQDGRRTRAQIAFADRVDGSGSTCWLWRPSDLESGKIDEWLTYYGRGTS